MTSNSISKGITGILKRSSHFNSATKPKLAHVVGTPPKGLIEVPVAQLFNQMTERYPNNILINSYSQNKSFTYQKAH